MKEWLRLFLILAVTTTVVVLCVYAWRYLDQQFMQGVTYLCERHGGNIQPRGLLRERACILANGSEYTIDLKEVTTFP